MNMKEFEKFMKTKKLNKVIRVNENYPRRSVDYHFTNDVDKYVGKLSQRTFIGLRNKGKLKLNKKREINPYTFEYVFDYKG